MNLKIDTLLGSPLVLLAGSEASLRLRALRELTSKLAEGGDEFDTATFTCDGSNFMDFYGAALTAPFLSEYRIVIVRNILRDKEPNDAGKPAALKSLPDWARLVLVADDENVDGQETTRRTKAWEKVITGAGGKVLSFSMDPKKAVEQLRVDVLELGKKLSPKAAIQLFAMCGNSYTGALEELDKLCLYVGDEEEIQEKDVLAAVSASREWNVFQLGDAMAAGQPDVAFRQLKLLAIGGTKSEEAANRNILPSLLRQFRLIWQARVAIDGGGIERVADDFPDNPNLAKMADWQQRNAMKAAQKLTRAKIEACMRELADADARLKGLIDNPNATEAIELMIVRTAKVIKG
ncbi:MAG: DNA polymerase III subunit delta [Armatimonadetes bacterium]|nr:DNA polymerase III subunit delta [Armatimonadota bacterium]